MTLVSMSPSCRALLLSSCLHVPMTVPLSYVQKHGWTQVHHLVERFTFLFSCYC